MVFNLLPIKKAFVLLFIIVAVSCSSVDDNAKNNLNPKPDVKKIALEKFGKDYFLSYNSTNKFILCTDKTKSKIPNSTALKYFVYDIDNRTIIDEASIPMGNVKWISDFEIMVEEHPGTIMKNSNGRKGYILNVKTNLKTKINGGVN